MEWKRKRAHRLNDIYENDWWQPKTIGWEKFPGTDVQNGLRKGWISVLNYKFNKRTLNVFFY